MSQSKTPSDTSLLTYCGHFNAFCWYTYLFTCIVYISQSYRKLSLVDSFQSSMKFNTSYIANSMYNYREEEGCVCKKSISTIAATTVCETWSQDTPSCSHVVPGKVTAISKSSNLTCIGNDWRSSLGCPLKSSWQIWWNTFLHTGLQALFLDILTMWVVPWYLSVINAFRHTCLHMCDWPIDSITSVKLNDLSSSYFCFHPSVSVFIRLSTVCLTVSLPVWLQSFSVCLIFACPSLSI